mmetsp:Transcript_98284/g.278228  ORF Transcript_98284/g.278228 Transcript_98284/m.278228 type:complete len:496 (-) Transcript_98284:882-2369(-)
MPGDRPQGAAPRDAQLRARQDDALLTAGAEPHPGGHGRVRRVASQPQGGPGAAGRPEARGGAGGPARGDEPAGSGQDYHLPHRERAAHAHREAATRHTGAGRGGAPATPRRADAVVPGRAGRPPRGRGVRPEPAQPERHAADRRAWLQGAASAEDAAAQELLVPAGTGHQRLARAAQHVLRPDAPAPALRAPAGLAAPPPGGAGRRRRAAPRGGGAADQVREPAALALRAVLRPEAAVAPPRPPRRPTARRRGERRVVPRRDGLRGRRLPADPLPALPHLPEAGARAAADRGGRVAAASAAAGRRVRGGAAGLPAGGGCRDADRHLRGRPRRRPAGLPGAGGPRGGSRREEVPARGPARARGGGRRRRRGRRRGRRRSAGRQLVRQVAGLRRGARVPWLPRRTGGVTEGTALPGPAGPGGARGGGEGRQGRQGRQEGRRGCRPGRRGRLCAAAARGAGHPAARQAPALRGRPRVQRRGAEGAGEVRALQDRRQAH